MFHARVGRPRRSLGLPRAAVTSVGRPRLSLDICSIALQGRLATPFVVRVGMPLGVPLPNILYGGPFVNGRVPVCAPSQPIA